MSLTIDQALQSGIEAHNAGRTHDAERFYLAILKEQRQHPEANHNMGVLALEVGKVEISLQYLKIALDANPRVAQFWLSYIEALIQADNVTDAKTLIDQAKLNGMKDGKFDELEMKLSSSNNNPYTSSLGTNDSEQKKANILDSLTLDEANKLAKKKAKMGLNEEARVLYEDIIIKFPHNNKAKQGLKLLLSERTNQPDKGQNPTQDQLKRLINLYNQGQLQKALDEAVGLLQQYPRSSVVYNICGAAHAGLKQYDASIESYKWALKFNPDYAEAYNNMGGVLRDKGELEASIDSYRQALKIRPDYAQSHNNIGVSLRDKGELESAISSYKQALKIKPSYAEAYNNLGVALRLKGELDASIDSYKQALEIKPDYYDAFTNMGNALQAKGMLDAAIDSFKQALKIKPDYAQAHNNMGVVLRLKGELDASIKCYKRALKIKPDYADAYSNMGNTQQDKNELDAAIDSFKHALRFNPGFAEVESFLLYQQQRICDWSASTNFREISSYLGITTNTVPPFTMLALDDDPAKHLERTQKYTAEKYKAQPISSFTKTVTSGARIRVGYFSSDFKEHPVAFLMAKVFESHDRESFEIYGYSLSRAKDSVIRTRLEEGFDNFREVQNLSDYEIAVHARHDGIDIAVDLTGHTKGSRCNIFALRAAPIQINYLGYPGTMGADFMDYIIADQNLIPVESREFYSEQPIYLPHHYMAQDDSVPISNETPSRADLGLPETGFVFCALHNTYKITPSVFDIWMRLLREIPGSVLWLLESNQWAQANLSKEAEVRGIESKRLVFKKGKPPHEEYLAQFRQADIFLDTFNYNAASTASDALWAGLPVLTKLGKSYSARMASSLVNTVGLPELVAFSEKEYEELALELAQNPTRLASIRARLTDNRLTSPLFKTKDFTRHLETGYKDAFQRYLERKKPGPIYVSK